MENYFIIHGSFGSPFGNWFSWLQDFIATDGKQVYVPDFPIGVGYQNYENWSKLLKYYLDLGLINENTTIIGHSIAPIFISKFLVENKLKVTKSEELMIMWNELGISGGTAIVILIALYFVIKWAVKNGIKEAYSAITGKKTDEDIQNEKELKELGLDSEDQ